MADAATTAEPVAPDQIIDPRGGDPGSGAPRGFLGLTTTQLIVIAGLGIAAGVLVWFLVRSPQPTQVTPCGCGDPPQPHIHTSPPTEAQAPLEVQVPTEQYEQPQG